MSGRGKGGKGLGKGGAKRHRKILRDNIQVRLQFVLNMLNRFDIYKLLILDRELPSPLSDVLPEEEVLNVFLVLSTRRPEEFSRFSLRVRCLY